MNNFFIAGIITWIYIGIMEIRLYNALSVAKKNKEKIEQLSNDVELINYGALPFVRQLAKIHAEDITEIRKEVAELSKMRVDAVEVVRCKDCMYYQQGRNADEWLWCMMNHHYTDEEKYCAWAERKEE